jgi:hypothetical protein
MKKSHLRFSAFLLLCFLGTGQGHAMWTKASDDELVKSSALIVEATYTGQSAFSADAGASRMTLGVLRVQKVLRGDPATELVFIRVPTIGLLRKSDDIVFTSGQQGLWFLRADSAYPGLYLADHPQRFVPDAQASEKVRLIQDLLH